MFKVIHGLAPPYLSELCKHASNSVRTRSFARGDFKIQRTRTKFGERAFAVAGPATWNSFTKRLPGCSKLTYAERRCQLCLLTLELCRIYIDLIVCYKIVFGIVKLEIGDFFSFNTNISTRGHPYNDTSCMYTITVFTVNTCTDLCKVW